MKKNLVSRGPRRGRRSHALVAAAPPWRPGRRPATRPGTTSLAGCSAPTGEVRPELEDFDIVEAAAFAVVDAKPQSPVGLLADGTSA